MRRATADTYLVFSWSHRVQAANKQGACGDCNKYMTSMLTFESFFADMHVNLSTPNPLAVVCVPLTLCFHCFYCVGSDLPRDNLPALSRADSCAGLRVSYRAGWPRGRGNLHSPRSADTHLWKHSGLVFDTETTYSTSPVLTAVSAAQPWICYLKKPLFWRATLPKLQKINMFSLTVRGS